ncbi:MAG: type II toxin-antitoxin system MqsR family toxin [Longimicrobiales bacterium]
MAKREPTYDLNTIQEKIRLGEVLITPMAHQGLADLYLDPSDIEACVCALEERHFRKTMESERRPGLWQDVYYCRYRSRAIYVKLQLAYGKAVVISFKQDTSA